MARRSKFPMCNLVCIDNSKKVRAYILEKTDQSLKLNIPRTKVFLELQRRTPDRPYIASVAELDFMVEGLA